MDEALVAALLQATTPGPEIGPDELVASNARGSLSVREP